MKYQTNQKVPIKVVTKLYLSCITLRQFHITSDKIVDRKTNNNSINSHTSSSVIEQHWFHRDWHIYRFIGKPVTQMYPLLPLTPTLNHKAYFIFYTIRVLQNVIHSPVHLREDYSLKQLIMWFLFSNGKKKLWNRILSTNVSMTNIMQNNILRTCSQLELKKKLCAFM